MPFLGNKGHLRQIFYDFRDLIYIDGLSLAEISPVNYTNKENSMKNMDKFVKELRAAFDKWNPGCDPITVVGNVIVINIEEMGGMAGDCDLPQAVAKLLKKNNYVLAVTASDVGLSDDDYTPDWTLFAAPKAICTNYIDD